MPSRYPALLDDETFDTLAPTLAVPMRETHDPVRDGLYASLRTLAAHAERMARGPFTTATLRRAALGAPFDPALAPVAMDPDGVRPRCSDGRCRKARRARSARSGSSRSRASPRASRGCCRWAP